MPSKTPEATTHHAEIVEQRAQLRAMAHEPRRTLSETMRAVSRIFAEARLANERVSR
jgi:hypothetical protein